MGKDSVPASAIYFIGTEKHKVPRVEARTTVLDVLETCNCWSSVFNSMAPNTSYVVLSFVDLLKNNANVGNMMSPNKGKMTYLRILRVEYFIPFVLLLN